MREDSDRIRVQRRDRAVPRRDDRHLQLLLAIELGERGAGDRRLELGQLRFLERRGLRCRQRIDLGHREGQVLDRRELDALDALEHEPAAVAEARYQQQQHRERSDRPEGNGRHRVERLAGQREVETAPRSLGAAARQPRTGRGRGGGGGEAALEAEAMEDLVGIQPEIAGVGSHIPGDEARIGKDLRLGVLDRRDVGGLDPQVALDVEQRLAERRALAPELVSERVLVGATTTRPRVERRRAHRNRPQTRYSKVLPGRPCHRITSGQCVVFLDRIMISRRFGTLHEDWLRRGGTVATAAPIPSPPSLSPQ